MADELKTGRVCLRLAPGLFRMDQIIKMTGQHTGYDASGNYWIFAVIKVLSGKMWFQVDGKKVAAPSDCFAMVLPKNSVVSLILKDVECVNSALFSKEEMPEDFGREPFAIALENAFEPNSVKVIQTVLRSAPVRIPISRATRPHPATLKIKKHLGLHFQEDIPLQVLAKLSGLAAEVLSRTFRKDWGKPPIHFRNYLRIIDSFRHLSSESAVTEAAFDVGFSDLSRFHKQFKKLIGDTPFAIKKRSRNAKK